MIFNRREPPATTNCSRFARSASSLVLVLVPALALVLVMVLMLVLVLVLELVLALLMVFFDVQVPLLYFQRNVASSVSPLPCIFRNVLENRSRVTEVATSSCLLLLCFQINEASSVSPLPQPLCPHFRSAASGLLLIVDIPFNCSALLY